MWITRQVYIIHFSHRVNKALRLHEFTNVIGDTSCSSFNRNVMILLVHFHSSLWKKVICMYIHGAFRIPQFQSFLNDFAEIFINLDTDLKIILLDHKNDYVKMSSMMSILATSLSVLHNYFCGPTKLFSDLYLVYFKKFILKIFRDFINCFHRIHKKSIKKYNILLYLEKVQRKIILVFIKDIIKGVSQIRLLPRSNKRRHDNATNYFLTYCI